MKALQARMKFELTILGSNSATPAFGRNQSSQVLNINETLYLVDCGEGTQLQMEHFSIKRNKIKYIFISHLHGDHYLGLVGLLSSMNLKGRKDEVHVFAPAELEELIELHLKYGQSELRYPMFFHPTQSDKEELILDNKDIQVFSFPLNHRIPCTGFRFNEKLGLPRMNKKAIAGLNIPPIWYPLIKQGDSFTASTGEIYTSKELTLPAHPPRSYAYCSDTLYDETYFEAIRDVSLLYHEATFMHDLLERASLTHHTTALQAGWVATATKAKRLIIGHFSSRYKDIEPLLEESRSVFPESYLAIEGQTFAIDFPQDD